MKKIILLNLLLVITVLNASDNGWYIGASKGVTNFENSPTIYKLGYLMNNSGRFEGYYKKDKVDVTSMGIRSEIGFLPFGESSTFLPFFSSALGVSKSYSNSSLDDEILVSMEYEFGLGMHYNIHDKFDISGGLIWRYIDIASSTGIEIGVSYHF